ncbi:MAG: group II intron maturase-specific domain-containing protein, partial [Polyangia bacterium]
MKRLKAKLRPVWKQGRGGSIASTVARLNPIIRGWVA